MTKVSYKVSYPIWLSFLDYIYLLQKYIMSRGLPLNVKLCLDKALDSALLSVETITVH